MTSIYQGWLTKRSHFLGGIGRRLFKNTRFFELQPKQLVYYADGDRKTHVRRTIKLNNADLVAEKGKNFHLTTTEHGKYHTFYFHAHSDHLKRKWIRKLNDAITSANAAAAEKERKKKHKKHRKKKHRSKEEKPEVKSKEEEERAEMSGSVSSSISGYSSEEEQLDKKEKKRKKEEKTVKAERLPPEEVVGKPAVGEPVYEEGPPAQKGHLVADVVKQLSTKKQSVETGLLPTDQLAHVQTEGVPEAPPLPPKKKTTKPSPETFAPIAFPLQTPDVSPYDSFREEFELAREYGFYDVATCPEYYLIVTDKS